LESCSSRILLPNDRILEPNTRTAYEKFGLNEKQLQILSTATPKRQYYYQSRLGNRLFDLELGPFAAAFCAASSYEDKQLVKKLSQKYPKEDFLEEYLKAKNLTWASELYQLHFKKVR